MFLRIYPQKDTFLSDFKRNSVQQTGSNFGDSEILHLYKQAGVSGAVGVSATSSIAHILTQFDLTDLAALSSSGELPDSAVYRLHLTDAQHKHTLPSSFDVEVQAVAQDWDEGRGRDVDTFSDKGVANWVKAKSNSYWTIPGASGSGPISTFHFDNGHEDLDVDVTQIVQAWLAGTTTNNGFLVKISSSQELDYQDYYIKMFHGRNTSFGDKRPYIEARWDDSLRDDRNNMLWSVSGSLFLYNVVHGQLTDIVSIGSGSIGVRVSDLSGTIVVVTGSRTYLPGIYSASFAITSSSFSGSYFNDVWFNLAATASFIMSGTFRVQDDIVRQDVHPKRYAVTVTNLKDVYSADEHVRLDLYVKPHDYNPAQVLTASLDSLGTVVTKAFYRIVNDRTEEVVVPFSTGALEYTRMSYDQKGNYMKFQMGSLTPGNVYRLTFLFDVDGQRQYIDQNHKFRVV